MLQVGLPGGAVLLQAVTGGLQGNGTGTALRLGGGLDVYLELSLNQVRARALELK